jgi:hypothetical protein
MTMAKVYPLNVESEIESLSTGVSGLREKAMTALVEARTEYEQLHSPQTEAPRKRNWRAGRGDRKLWEAIEERIEDAFENLDDAIRQIRKPFRT